MKAIALLVALVSLTGNAAITATKSLDELRWKRRILIVSANNPHDRNLVKQRILLAKWRKDADDRDVSYVEIAGAGVIGASDTSDSLRRRYRISANGFQVTLIGKDGHVALTSNTPVTPNRLSDTIDAMPMRRAGER